MQDIINTLLYATDANTRSEYLSAISGFITYKFKYHCTNLGDKCSFTSWSIFGDEINCLTYQLHVPTKGVHIHSVQVSIFLIGRLRSAILETIYENNIFQETITDVSQHFNEWDLKFRLSIAHKGRCIKQNNAFTKIHNKMKKTCVDLNGKKVIAYIIKDFKIKFEPISWRATTLGYHGKREIIWHGICIEYHLLEDKEHNDSNIITKESNRYILFLLTFWWKIQINSTPGLSQHCLVPH